MRCVLVVEDDDLIRETVKDLLELAGYEVLIAENGQDALNLLKTRSANLPGLILLDLMMPVMSGWEFLSARALEPTISAIPVVVVSAVANPSALTRVSEIIHKPFNLENLMKTVSKYCQAA